MEVPRLGVESELLLLACPTAMATPDLSCICALCCRLQDSRVLNPLSHSGNSHFSYVYLSSVYLQWGVCQGHWPIFLIEFFTFVVVEFWVLCIFWIIVLYQTCVFANIFSKSVAYLSLDSVFCRRENLNFFFFCTCSMQKFPGQGSNPSHSGDNAKSLTARWEGTPRNF